MIPSKYSVHDVWTKDELLTKVLIDRIRECGRYSPYNPEWQSLSTMIDYALKTVLAKKEELTNRLLDKLSEIGYIPLDRVASTPSVKFGEIDLSPDGTIGVDVYNTARADPNANGLMIQYALDIYLTGSCTPIFTVFLNGRTFNIRYAISPDSKRLAVLYEGKLTVWGLADCRILYQTEVAVDEDDTEVLWSGDSEKAIITHHGGFRVFRVDDGTTYDIIGYLNDRSGDILVNEDASEFVYCNSSGIYRSAYGKQPELVVGSDIDFRTCYLVRSAGVDWVLIDNGIYRIDQDGLKKVKDADLNVDTDPNRFEEIMGDFMSQRLNDRNSFVRHCSVRADGDRVSFTTRLGTRTHNILMDASSLTCESFVTEGDSPETCVLRDGDRTELLCDGVNYIVTKSEDGEQSRLLIEVGGEKHPLGTCRFDTEAVYANGRIFVHKGRSIEVYDSKDLRLLMSRLAIDCDRWVICGSDKNGTVSLVKVEDVESDISRGSKAKLRFARMKAPDFQPDEFEDCFVIIDKVWNLRFSVAVRDDILFFYNRDGNRVKPVTLNRFTLRSKGMKRSSTRRSDESKFDARICELSGERIAVISLDDRDDKKPRATIRIISCGRDRTSELCEVSKHDESGSLMATSITDAFVLVQDGHGHVVVQFGTGAAPKICSRDADSRRQYPEKGYIEGTVVEHDGETCIIRGSDGTYSRFDARMNRLGAIRDHREKSRAPYTSNVKIPLNKEFKASFGKIVQNYGVFFCLKGVQ